MAATFDVNDELAAELQELCDAADKETHNSLDQVRNESKEWPFELRSLSELEPIFKQ
jgi:phosphate uptake regulator